MIPCCRHSQRRCGTDRWKQHIRDIRKAKKNDFGYGTCVELAKALDKHGYQNFEHEILFECDDCDLDMLEQKMIYHYKTLYPHGYNLTTGGKNCKYSNETKNKMSNIIKEKVSENISSYRIYDEQLKGLPKCVSYVPSQKGKYGYRIFRHPKCNIKLFTSDTKSLLELKKDVLDFLSNIENSESEYKSDLTKKVDNGIPKGISIKSTGLVQMRFYYKTKLYYKSFPESLGTQEERIQIALSHMNNLKQQLKNNTTS